MLVAASSWDSGDNGGSGFQAWNLVANRPGSPFAGFFIGDSTSISNKKLSVSGDGGNINASNGKSFGLYGGTGVLNNNPVNGQADAYRSFDTPLSVFNFRNGYKGLDLRSGDTGEPKIFNFNLGGDNYAVSDSASGNGTITNNDYSNNSVFHLLFTQSTAAGGTWQITRTGGQSSFNAGTYSGSAINPTINIAAGTGLNLVAGNVLQFDGGGNTFNGARGINVYGAGTVKLLSAAKYTGAAVVNSEATLQLGNDTTDGSIATTSAVTDNGSLVYNIAGTQTAAYAISGTGSLTNAESGTLILAPGNGTNSYNGTNAYGSTYLNGGTLQIYQGQALGNAPNTPTSTLFFNGGTLQFASSNLQNTTLNTNRGMSLSTGGGTVDVNGNAISYGGAITGAGALTVGSTKSGGSLLLSGNASNYTGGTTISSGATVLANGQ